MELKIVTGYIRRLKKYKEPTPSNENPGMLEGQKAGLYIGVDSVQEIQPLLQK